MLYFDYYILAEISSCIFSALLCYNVFTTLSPSERKQRCFFYGSLATFLASGLDVLSVYCISNWQNIPYAVCMLVSSAYFISLISVPYYMAKYAIEVAYSYGCSPKHWHAFSNTVYAGFLVLLVINVFTGLIFSFNRQFGYVRGPLTHVTYFLSFIFMLCTVVPIIRHKDSMARRLYFIFLFYPVIAALILSVQFFFPKILLTGAASFATLLLAYVSIQSDMLEYDLITGLVTEHSLKKRVENKTESGYLGVFALDNISTIQNFMEVSDLNKMLLFIGKELSGMFKHDTFYLGSGRFAAFSDDLAKIQAAGTSFNDSIVKINRNMDFNLPMAIDNYSAVAEISRGDKSYNNVIELINSMISTSRIHSDHNMRICDESVLLNIERKRFIFKILKRELNVDSSKYQVWFQPIYSIENGKFMHMEALSRLKDTEIGDIPPQEFVEVAENRGLIEKLGFTMFEKVCKFISENKKIVGAISVNFSVHQMTNPDVVNIVLSTIKKFGIKPQNIIMEITESIFIDNYEVVLRNMKSLSKEGIRFYLDDFGTGYSNLANVVSLPFNTIKIDRSLVLMMEESSKGVSLFNKLAGIFKEQGLKILVEGVETQPQNELVCKAGVDYIQGFLYSRPLSAEACIEFLKQKN